MRKINLTIILPVYNEGKNISSVVSTINKKIKIAKEVLVVYDFEKDDTVPVVKKLQKKYKDLKLIKNNIGKGILNAIKSGFNNAKGDILVVMPADLADNPETINKMYEKIKGGYDLVCATRYTKGGKKYGGGVIKSTLSRLAGLSAPLILGIPTTDLSNGFKMYRKELVKKIEIVSDGGWEFATELTIKANKLGYKITEVPSTWKNRVNGKSHFKLRKWLPKYIRWYIYGIKTRLSNSS